MRFCSPLRFGCAVALESASHGPCTQAICMCIRKLLQLETSLWLQDARPCITVQQLIQFWRCISSQRNAHCLSKRVRHSLLYPPLHKLRSNLAHKLLNAQGLADWIGNLLAAMRTQGIPGSSFERSATLSAMQQARPGCYVYATHRSGCSRHLTWSATRASS